MPLKRSAAQVSGFTPDEPNKARKLSATDITGSVSNGFVQSATFMPTLAPAMEREMPEACPECGSDDIIENWQQGNAECRGCGLVLAERLLDLGSEWRTFTQEEGDDPNRVGGPANPLLEGGLGTDIGAGGKGGNRMAAALHRAQQRNGTSAADKVMISVMGRIDRLCERLSFLAANNRAKELFSGYRNHLTLRPDGTRTRSLRDEETTEIIAASIFIACRNLEAARTYKEVCALTGVARKIIGATVKKIELAIPGAKTNVMRSTDDFVTRFCTRLNLPQMVQNATLALSKTVNENELYGKTYTTVCAACIYVVSQLCEKKDKRTPAEIAAVTGVAEVTIRSTYKLMHPHLTKSLPKDFKPHESLKSLPTPCFKRWVNQNTPLSGTNIRVSLGLEKILNDDVKRTINFFENRHYSTEFHTWVLIRDVYTSSTCAVQPLRRLSLFTSDHPETKDMTGKERSIRNLTESQTLKWIFVGGKGGVGKTTTSCSLSVALAATRKSVLLVSTDPAHNLSDAFAQKFSRTPTRVRGFDNLDAMEVEPPAASDLPNVPSALTQAADSTSNGLSSDVIDALGGEQAAKALMSEIGNAIPGIDEAMAFATIMKSVRDMSYDVVVFDTAPTGHTMRLLGFPNLLEKGLNFTEGIIEKFGSVAGHVSMAMGLPGLNLNELRDKLSELQNTTKDIKATFADNTKTTFLCVCIPEFLSVFETERLVQELGKFKISVSNIIVNQVIRTSDIQNKERAEKLYKARMAMQTKYLEQVAELYGEDFHITPMPLLSGEVRGTAALKNYSELILKTKDHFFKNMEGMNELEEYEGSLKNIVEDDKLRWVFMGGKGGVGKTTTSSSTAVAFENLGRKVLIVSTDPAHNLSDAFAQKISSGTNPTKITAYNNLYALEVDASDAAENFITNLSTNASAMNGSTGGGGGMPGPLPVETIRQLVTSVPGIDEAVSFAEIAKLARTLEFDVVVFDTAPTGHTLRLLGFPAVADKALAKFESLKARFQPMLSMLTAGDMQMESRIKEAEEKLAKARKSLEEVSAILTDHEKTTFVCVAIAEFLSVYETERLVQQLCEMDINVRNILVNQLMNPEEKNMVEVLTTRSKMQGKYLEQIDELYPNEEFHITQMPLLPMEVRGVENLQTYGNIAVKGDSDK